MKLIKSGLAKHCHHERRLYEYVYDYDERVEYILAHKPPEERPLRRRLFQLVPADRLPGRDSPAWAAYFKGGAALDKVAYDKAELCLDCPWDGKTIFTRKNEAGEWY